VTFALSDLVRGLVVLSVHPRQAEVAPGAAKAFGFSIPAGVHETDMPKYLGNVRCWVNSGKHLLSLSFSGFDPTQTSADSVDQQLYSLKAERLATVSIIGC